MKSASERTRHGRGLNLEEAVQATDPLQNVAPVDLLEFLCHTDRYQVSGGRPASRPRLHYPMGTVPRTAVVGRDVEERHNVKCFSGIRSAKLVAFDPQALAAPADALRAACDSAEPLQKALIAFTGILEGPLTQEDSNLFWNTYQVPVFEQFLGMGGELLAWECEIHQGLHIREEAAIFEPTADERIRVSFLANPRLPLLRLETGLAGRIETNACPCGDKSPRLVDLRRRSVKVGSTRLARMAEAAVG